jgi:hypothetical protein
MRNSVSRLVGMASRSFSLEAASQSKPNPVSCSKRHWTSIFVLQGSSGRKEPDPIDRVLHGAAFSAFRCSAGSKRCEGRACPERRANPSARVAAAEHVMHPGGGQASCGGVARPAALISRSPRTRSSSGKSVPTEPISSPSCSFATK